MKNIFNSQAGGTLKGNASVSSFHPSEAGYGDTNSQYSARSNKRMKPNPLFGYKIEKITSVNAGTVILRVKHKAFMDFLHPETIGNWHEKD